MSRPKQYIKTPELASTLEGRKDVDEQLCARIRAGDRKAGSDLLRLHNRAIYKTALHYLVSGVDMDDLLQEGRRGVLRAAKDWDSSRGTFLTYAVWWVKSYVVRYMQETCETIRKPANIMLHVSRIKKKIAMGEALSNAERKVFGKYSCSVVVPNQRRNEDGDVIDVVSHLPDTSETIPDTSAQELGRYTAILDRREMEIVSKLYGLGGGHPHTLQEVGDDLGLSRERVRQIRNKALRLMANRAMANRARADKARNSRES